MILIIDGHISEIRRFCAAVQKRVLDGVVDREVEKGEQRIHSLMYECGIYLARVRRYNLDMLVSSHSSLY